VNASISTATPGSFTFHVSGSDVAGNQSSATSPYTVGYAPPGTLCLGEPEAQILQPVNADGTMYVPVDKPLSVCKSLPTLLESATVNETVVSTGADTSFRFDARSQQWILNLSTKGLAAGKTYVYRITLNDGSSTMFQFGLR
jgi:hypothetical protein